MPPRPRRALAASVAAATLALPVASAAAVPPTPSELGDATFRDVGALCTAWVAHQRAQDRSATRMIEELVVREPRCVPEAQPVPFTPTGTWRGLHVVRVDDGVATGRRLVVQTTRGHSLAAPWWDVDDPRDPGCPSIIRDVAIDAVSVQHGTLVIVFAGERGTMVEPTSPDDHGWRTELVRTAHWGRDDGGAVKLATHDLGEPLAGGVKLQPSGEPARRVAWEKLPWRGWAPFLVDRAGDPVPSGG